MANSIGEALTLLARVGQLNIEGMHMDAVNQTTYHRVNHKYREVIVIPMGGMTDNIDFLLSKGDKYITFSDGVRAKVTEYKEVHICELEKDITELYHVDPWTFVKKWHNVSKGVDSMYFLKIKTERMDNDEK